jgi:hypothetical protein
MMGRWLVCARLSGWISRVSSGWVALATLAVFLVFSALALPAQAAKAEADAGDAGTPDTSLYYSARDLYRMAEAYGERGRAAYVKARFTFDVVWPVVYTLFLSTAIGWLYGKAFAAHSRWQRANLAPLLGAGFDYLENLSTSVVMLRYPAHTAVVDSLAPLFTVVKWAFVGGSFALLVVGIVAAVWQWIGKRRRAG